MYTNLIPHNYYYPYNQDDYLYSTIDPQRFGVFPPGQGQGGGPPNTPPPSYVPAQTQTFAVDPGGIRRCLFRFTYVWLRGFQQFWFYPTFVGRNSVSGYRWTGFRWVYFGISLRQIQSFTCI
jgi:hypothetical protein